MDGNTRLIDMTVDELRQLIRDIVTSSVSVTPPDEYVYGLQGLADTLGCTREHACKIKNQGMYRQYISQQGRKIIVNKTQLLKHI